MRFMRFVLCVVGLWGPWSGDTQADGDHILDTSEEGMKKIATALGVECIHCHVAKTPEGKPDFGAVSAFKATTLHMKTHFVDSLRMADGEILSCENCHNGHAQFIPREPDHDLEPLSANMERREVMKMMRGFTKSLGVKCLFCHEKATDGRMDPTIPTKHVRMARFMVDNFTSFTTLDGSPATCMTCHQGKAKYLPRHDGE